MFRAAAGAVRGGAARVLVPSTLRPVLAPALVGAPRVARAIAWIDGMSAPPDGAVLVPVGAVLGVGVVATMLGTRPPAVHVTTRDVGLPVVAAPASLVAALWPALAHGTPLDDALDQALAHPATRHVREHSLVQPVTDARAAALGERRLYDTLGSAIDTRLDTVFHRRLSRLVSRLAVRFGIAPNAITVASLVVGLCAAWMFWRATPLAATTALVLYAVAVVLDHADGEVARLTLTESSIGEWLDIVADTVVHVAVVLALGATSAELTGHGATLGVLAALGFVASATVARAWPGLAMPDRVGTFLSNLGSRDGFYVMLLAFIVGRSAWPPALPWLMIVVAAGSHAYWVGRLIYRLTRGA